MVYRSADDPPLSYEDCAATHPGFHIICICGRDRVYVENSCGHSAESGGWGSVELVCAGCGARVSVYDNF